MEFETEIDEQEQQQPTQEDPPSKKLYDGLKQDGLYTKSFEEFQKQYGTSEGAKKLHKNLTTDSLYTKSEGDFVNQYFPEIKKKEIPIGSVGGSFGKPKSELEQQVSSFKGNLKGVPLTNVRDNPNWKKQATKVEEPKEKVADPFFDIDKTIYNVNNLTPTEKEDFEKLQGFIATGNDEEIAKTVIESRNNPSAELERAQRFIKKETEANVADNLKFDLSDYADYRRKELDEKITSVGEDIAKDALDGVKPNENPKNEELQKLLTHKKEFERYTNVMAQNDAVNKVDRLQYNTDGDYYKAIGREVRKVQDLKAVNRKEQALATGEEANRSTEVTQKEDYNDELSGIEALRNDIIRQYNSGQLGGDVAKQQMEQLNKQDATLEERYPAMAVDNIRKYLGDYIAKKRKAENSGVTSFLQNTISAEPDAKEVMDAITDLRSNQGVKITDDQAKEIFKDLGKIPLTSVLGHFYKSSILHGAKQLNNIFLGEQEAEEKNAERDLSFRDPTMYQSIQPNEIPEAVEVAPATTREEAANVVRMIPNPEAGKHSDILSWATANNIGEVAGTIASYVAGNKIAGAVAEKALGAIAGAETIGYAEGLKPITQLTSSQRNLISNIASSTFLNYHDNLEQAKQLTDDKDAQALFATAKSLVTGFVFAEFNPNRILGTATTAENKTAAQKFLDAFKEGKAGLQPEKLKNIFKDWAKNTAKDLGHNISLIKADQIAGLALERLTGGEEAFKGRNVVNEVIGNLPSDVISLLPFSAVVGFKKAAGDAGIRNAIRMAVSDPVKFEEGMNQSVKDGKLTPEDAAQKIDYIKSFAEKLKSADLNTERTKNLTPDARIQYAGNLLSEERIKNTNGEIKDEVQLKDSQKEVEELQKERQSILEDSTKENTTLPPEYNDFKESGVVVDEARDVAQPIPLETKEEVITRNEQPALAEQSPEPIKNEEAATNEVPVTEKTESVTVEEPAKVIGETEPAKEEIPEPVIHVDPKKTILSHRGLQEVATEWGLDDVTARERVSDLREFKDAETTIDKWVKEGVYSKNIEKIVTDAENKEALNPQQRLILQQHIANVRGKVAEVREKNGINSPEYDKALAELNRLKIAGQTARSTAGASLRIGEDGAFAKPTVEDWMAEKMESSGVDELTNRQKAEVEKMFVEYEAREKKANEKLELANAKIAELKAGKEIKKAASVKKKTGTKKTAEDYKAERQSLKDKLKQQLEEFKDEGQKMGISSDGNVRSFLISAKMVRTVGEMVKSHVEEIGDNLKEVTNRVFEDIKDLFPDLKHRDIHDIIAGEYNEKRPTKSQLEVQVNDVRRQAKLLNKLDDLLNGEEPKSEAKKVERNQQIKKLREQIKNIEGFEKELKKAEKETVEQKASSNKNIDKELSKAEKEIQDAEEKEARKKYLAAEREARRLEKEFEREQNQIKKKQLKANADEARRIARELDKKTDEEKALETVISRNKKTVERLEEAIKNGNFEPQQKKPFEDNEALKSADPKLWSQAMDAVIAKDAAKDKFLLEKRKDELAKRSTGKKGLDFLTKLISTSKAVKAGIDDSVGGVQLILAAMGNPTSAAKAKFEAFADTNNKRFKQQLASLHSSSMWKVIQGSGLDITEPSSKDKDKAEELYAGNLLDRKMKIFGNRNPWTYTGGIFERWFTSFGNNMRLNLFLSQAQNLAEQGKTFDSHPQEYKDVAKSINELTGRGKLHESLKTASPAITPFIWAPRMLSSSLNILGLGDAFNPLTGRKGFYTSLTPSARMYALKNLGKGVGVGVSIMTVLAMAGWDVDANPESATFGAVKKGTKSYNVFGRFGGVAKTVTQLITGRTKYPDSMKDWDKTGGRGSMLMKFFRGKMTPFAGEVYDIALNSQKNYFTKKPVDFSIGGIAKDLLEPISVSEMRKGLEQDGALSLLTRFLPAVEGIQVSDDRDFAKEGDYTKEQLESPEFKILKDKGIEPPKAGTIKQYEVDKDDAHPDGHMTEDEYKIFINERTELISDGIKKILNKKYQKSVEYQDGRYKTETVEGKDLEKEELKNEISKLTSEITASLKKKMGLVKEKEKTVTVEALDE